MSSCENKLMCDDISGLCVCQNSETWLSRLAAWPAFCLWRLVVWLEHALRLKTCFDNTWDLTWSFFLLIWDFTCPSGTWNLTWGLLWLERAGTWLDFFFIDLRLKSLSWTWDLSLDFLWLFSDFLWLTCFQGLKIWLETCFNERLWDLT